MTAIRRGSEPLMTGLLYCSSRLSEMVADKIGLIVYTHADRSKTSRPCMSWCPSKS